MKHIVAVFVLTFAAWAAPTIASASASAAPVPAPTQTFVAGGIGFVETGFSDDWGYAGTYTSSSQFGSGYFTYDSGITPNKAEFRRTDGMILKGTTKSVSCAPVDPNTQCFNIDLAGTADITNAHLDVAVPVSVRPSGFLIRGTLTLSPRLGYAMVDANGTTYSFGGIDHFGDAHISHITDIERTPSGKGYWTVMSTGTVFAFGDAKFYGSAGYTKPDEAITSMSVTPTGKGYWLFSTKGHAYTFGDAQAFGDLNSTMLNGRIIGSIATPTGKGYYMVGADGGVFAFGDAKFRGSMGNAHLNQPVVGLVPTPANTGYWLVARDGGVFSFNAPFKGSLGAIRLNQPIVTMVPYGAAYLMVASDGGVFNFSTRPFFGSLGGRSLPASITNATATG